MPSPARAPLRRDAIVEEARRLISRDGLDEDDPAGGTAREEAG